MTHVSPQRGLETRPYARAWFYASPKDLVDLDRHVSHAAGDGGPTPAQSRRHPVACVQVMVELETTDPEGTTATHSVLLQNAETVKLVGPAAAAAPSSPPATAIEAAPVPQQPAPQAQPASVVPLTLTSGKEAGCTTATTSSAPSSSTPDAAARVPSNPAEHAKPPRAGASPASGGPGSQKQVPSWRTLSVSSLRPGDQVFVLLQPPARHTGIAIEEFIVEK